MPILSNSGNSWLYTLKLLIMSIGVVCFAVILKLSAPTITSQVSLIWSILLPWLSPPYLYILINGIIISIVASSKIHRKSTTDDPVPEILISTTVQKFSSDVCTEYEVLDDVVLNGYNYDSTVAKEEAVVPEVELEDVYARVAGRAAVPEKETDKYLIGEANSDRGDECRELQKMPERMDSVELLFLNGKEEHKLPVSARFSHRKAPKPIPEGGKALGVSKPKRQDTLESTWRTITDGRAMPLARHLKKSDTWEQHGRHPVNDDRNSASKVKKTETFNDRTSSGMANTSLSRSTGSGKLKREPSLGQDELNKRVEAFINKFNEEMRLQRQESLNQFQEMISRGALF